MENSNESAKLVPGVCPQCGGQLEVDPKQEAAVCSYCGTPFIVSKAINNYHVQNAHIDHVDNLHVDLKGSVDSLIGLAEREFDKNRAERKEEKKRSDDMAAIFFKNFWKFVLILFAASTVFWFIANALGFFN